MAKTVRLTNEEEKALNDVALELNRELVKMGKMPLRDTEIFHEVIEQTLMRGIVEVTRNGDIRILGEKEKN